MRNLSRKTRQKVDERFRQREAEVISATTFDLDALRPALSGEDLDALKVAVREATERNQSLAQLKARLEAMGEQGKRILDKLAELI